MHRRPPRAIRAGDWLPTIFPALEKQLGLRLEKVRDVPVDVIVVDRLDKIPTENCPERACPDQGRCRRSELTARANSLLRADLLLVIEDVLDGPEGEEFPSVKNPLFQHFFKINQDGILPADRHVGIAALRSHNPAAGRLRPHFRNLGGYPNAPLRACGPISCGLAWDQSLLDSMPVPWDH